MKKKYLHSLSESKYMRNMMSSMQYATPLKRSMSGYEIELNIINKTGDVSNSSEDIIRQCRKISPKFEISKEVGKNMVEVMSLPHAKVKKTALHLIDNVSKVQDICEKDGIFVMPLGTYPGSFKEQVWKKDRYLHSARAIGQKRYFYYFSHCFGFHYHYTLPKGVFDHKKKSLKTITRSKIKKSLIDSFNFLVAADPAITTFMQSSPFADGKYVAKDSRMVFLRGRKILKHEGLFGSAESLGELQRYNHTLTDIRESIYEKHRKFVKMLKASGAPEYFVKNKFSMDYMWNPIKINKLGTIEERGMDTNYLSICLAASVMIKFVLRAIHQEFYHVQVSDIALKEPFRLEGNVIFIPPQADVRKKLQFKSAYYGFSDGEMFNACKRLYALARKLTYREYLPTLKPIKEMLDSKKTVSDQIIDQARRKGCTDTITQEVARHISLLHAKRMIKDTDRARKVYENLND